MTELEMQDLCNDVSLRHNIKPFIQNCTASGDCLPKFWLYEDSARCFDLMVEYGISIEHGLMVVARLDKIFVIENLQSNNNDKWLSARIAILKVLTYIRRG